MSTPTSLPSAQRQTRGTGVRPRRWTREEYYRAADLGLFRPDERLELLDGEIIEKLSAQKTPHFTAVRATMEALSAAFGTGFEIRPPGPLTLSNISEPEPDVLVVPGTWRDYEDHHPGPEEVRLLVEVSDTTLRMDRGRKASAYARAGIAEYWILNPNDRCLEIHRDPVNGVYQTITTHLEADSVSPLAAPAAALHVTDLLPSRPAQISPRSRNPRRRSQ